MDNSLDKIWKEKPEVVRRFYEKLPVYERLCDEVKYILNRRILADDIEIGHLTSRAKSLSSFCEKMDRKKYSNPFEEITDLAGVRVVYLYLSDRVRLENVIELEFEVLEKVDKISSQDIDKFGYGALHYVVRLKRTHAGARYDDLREVFCEIQIRTILQDAWAIVAHHLSYKHESDIPKELRRKLNALSGLFETADDQFEQINFARVEYQVKVKKDISENTELSLDVDINLDNLLGYLSWKFPDRKPSTREEAADLLEELQPFGYEKLKLIDDAVNSSWQEVLENEAESPPSDMEGEPAKYTGIGLIRCAMDITDAEYRAWRDGN